MNIKKVTRFLIILPILGLIAGYLLMNRSLTLVVDGNTTRINTHALTVKGALRSAGYTLSPGDAVVPAANAWLGSVSEINLIRAGSMYLWIEPEQTLIPVNTTERTPLGLLSAAGFAYHEGDVLKLNGRPVQPTDVLPASGRIVLQYTPSVSLTVSQNGHDSILYSSAAWLGKALWDGQIDLRGANLLTVPYTTLLQSSLSVNITPAVQVSINVDGTKLSRYVPDGNVGQALAQVGVSLQDLDYSKPAENEPIPSDGKIQVVRVREEVIREQTTIPYNIDTTSDAELPVGEVKVITAGVPGIQVVTIRVRYENGKEVSRDTEAAVVLKAPVTQVQTVGSKFAIQTMNTPYGPISYYRTVTVRATSYSPCRSAADQCYPLTASGAPVKYGVIAVTSAWYDLFKGDQLYVPGYGIGTILDIGGGIPGKYWIDLGYSDSDWVLWSKNVEIYFLTPIPPNAPAVLP